MKYKEAMASKDKEYWIEAVMDDFKRYTKRKVYEPVKLEYVPKGTKLVTTTWAMKRSQMECTEQD